MMLVPLRLERIFRGVGFRLTRKLAERDPRDVWPGIDAATTLIRPFSGRFGNVSRYELMVLCAVARVIEARSIFEFGTFDGLTAWHLATNCGPEARVWTLDLPLDHPARARHGHDRQVGKIGGVVVGAQFHDTPQAGQIEQIYCDSLLFDPSPFRGRIDFCFIDAGHGYEHVRRDTENALAMTRVGGVIVWHDYSRWWPGVQQVLDDLSARLPAFQVEGTALAAVQIPARSSQHPTRPASSFVEN
jgi:predicted O-methyltransferase YrrM